MDNDAPGWDAIEHAIARAGIAGQGEVVHYGGTGLPGQGVYGISAYPTRQGWFLVTFGLTDLFGGPEPEPGPSGWGFELTMRVPRHNTDVQPPAWAVQLVSKLGNYAASAGHPFADGHRLSPGGPITGTADTRLTAIAFVADPEVPAFDAPAGHVQLLRVVGITAEELARMQAGTTHAVTDELRAADPTLTTDPAR